MARAFDALTGWTLFAGLTFGLGAVASRWLVLPRAWPGSAHGPAKPTSAQSEPSGDPGPASLRPSRQVATVGLLGAILSAAGVALYFVRQLREFRDPFVPWTEDASLLLSTPWGASWKAATVVAVLLVAAFALARRGTAPAWWPATLLILGLAAFPGLTGHASGVEEHRALALLADWAHVTAAGTWIGGLAVVLFLARGLTGTGKASPVGPMPGESALSPLVRAFSPVAMGSVAVLVLSGTYAAWLHVPGITGLVTTGYGRALTAKLGLVAVVLSFGARNFRVLTPRLGEPEGDRALIRSAALELAVAQAVLVVTALLVRMSPMD